MGKVVTSQGLVDYVTTGAVEQIQSESSPPEPKADSAAEQLPAGDTPVPAEAPEGGPSPIEELSDFTPEEREQLGKKVTSVIGKRTREMKAAREAQQAARDAQQEAEEWGKQQYLEKRAIESAHDELVKKVQDWQRGQDAQAAQTPQQGPRSSDAAFQRADGTTDWEKFVDAKSAWAAQQAVQQDRVAREQAALKAQLEAQEAATQQRYAQAASSDQYPDFAKVIREKSGDVLMHPSVIQYIREADQGPGLHYYLVTHPDEAERLRKLSPVTAVAEAAQIAARLKGEAMPGTSGGGKVNGSAAPAVEEKQAAPPPITPISASGAGTLVDDPAKMSFKQLREFERKRQSERRR